MTFTHALSTNNYGPAKFIVDSNPALGTHTTLASAMSAASSGDTIYLRESVTEDITLTPGVNIASYNANGQNGNVEIVGKITMTGAGLSSISGVRLTTNSDYCIVVSGSAASQLRLKDCYLNVTDASAINYTSSEATSFIELVHCSGAVEATLITYHVMTSAGVLRYINSFMKNNGVTTTASTNSAGIIRFLSSSFQVPLETSGTGVITGQNSNMNIPDGTNAVNLTTAGTGSCNFTNSFFASGSSSGISIGANTTVALNNCGVTSSNANAITGAGTLTYTSIGLGSNSDINPTTQTGFVTRVGAIRSATMPAFYAYLASADTNATGDGTIVTIGSITALTEITDQGTDFNTNGTFTAPYTGMYGLHSLISVSNLAAGHTTGLYQIVTSNRTANYNAVAPTTVKSVSTGTTSMGGTFLSDMDSMDTAIIRVLIAGSTKTVTVDGGASPNTHFAGWLVC